MGTGEAGLRKQETTKANELSQLAPAPAKKAKRMGEAPCSVAAPRRAAATAAHFRLPRHGLRRKVLVVRLGGGGAGAGTRAVGHGRLCGGLRRIKLRWLRGAMWRLAEFCVAALSGPPGLHPDAPPPWTGVEPYFAAPFVPAVLVRRAAGQDYS